MTSNGNINLIFGAKTNGSERDKHDFYATNPKAIYASKEMFVETKLSHKVWECACGEGNISEALKALNYKVFSSDLIDRGYADRQIDFLNYEKQDVDYDIVTNPPFKLAKQFIEKSMDILKFGRKSYWFVKIQFLESANRKKLFDKFPPKYIYAFSERQSCTKNNKPEIYGWGGTFFYCWIIFEKGWKGPTEMRWI